MSEEFREEFAGPQSSKKANKLHCFREGRVIKVCEKRKLLDDSRNPKVVKTPKIQHFLDFPKKGRVCQKSFERNSRGQKVVKNNSNYTVFVKVGSSKFVKNVSC